MEYPIHLLPKVNFKFISWGEWLKDHYLLRFTPDYDLRDPETGLLREDYVYVNNSWSQGKDYSTNLLGIYTIEDRCYQTVGSRKRDYFDNLWEEGEIVDIPQFPDDFMLNAERGAFFIKIGDIVDQVVYYNKGNETGFSASSKLFHTPTKSNFWHFSIRWENDEGDINEQKGSWIRNMLKTQVKTLIKECARLEEPEFTPLDESFFVNSSSQEISR